MRNTFVSSGASAAFECYQNMLVALADARMRKNKWRYATARMWFGWFKAKRAEAIANGYEWTEATNDALRRLRFRTLGNQKTVTATLDVHKVPAHGRNVTDSTDNVGRNGPVQPMRKHKSRPLPALEAKAQRPSRDGRVTA